MLRKLVICSVASLGWVTSTPANAELRIFACEPEWAALAREIGGDKITAYSATHEQQDPHYIRARPSLIAKIRRADMVFCTGAELEIGWLPLLMQRGARAKIRTGKPGHFMAAQHVPLREKPIAVDRSMGDVHPDGNPHIHLDPRNIILIARELTKRLSKIDAQNAGAYAQNLKAFESGWAAQIMKWQKQSLDLKDMPVVVHHRSWSYLIAWLGLKEVGSLEAKPGIPPTASHLQALLKTATTAKTKAILRTPYDQSAPSDWLAPKANIPALILPYTVSREAQPGSLKLLFDNILSLLKRANGQS